MGLASGDRSDDDERFRARGYACGQIRVGRFVGHVDAVCEKPDQGAALHRHVVPNGAAQHGITGLQGLQDGPLGYSALELQLDLPVGGSAPAPTPDDIPADASASGDEHDRSDRD